MNQITKKIEYEYDFRPVLPERIKSDATFAIIFSSLRHFWMISSSKTIQYPFSAIVHSHGIFHKMAIWLTPTPLKVRPPCPPFPTPHSQPSHHCHSRKDRIDNRGAAHPPKYTKAQKFVTRWRLSLARSPRYIYCCASEEPKWQKSKNTKSTDGGTVCFSFVPPTECRRGQVAPLPLPRMDRISCGLWGAGQRAAPWWHL